MVNVLVLLMVGFLGSGGWMFFGWLVVFDEYSMFVFVCLFVMGVLGMFVCMFFSGL